jgi:hypothetical protein
MLRASDAIYQVGLHSIAKHNRRRQQSWVQPNSPDENWRPATCVLASVSRSTRGSASCSWLVKLGDNTVAIADTPKQTAVQPLRGALR